MSQEAGKPADPAHEAKLAARRQKHALKVWRANPKTQQLQQEHDAAVHELQILRDGTAGPQFKEMKQRCERLEGEREALEKEKEKEKESAQFWKRSYDKEKKEKEEDNKYWKESATSWKGYYDEAKKEKEEAEAELEKLEKLKASGRGRRGAAPEPEEEVEENPVVLLCKQHAEDRREITAKLAKVDRTMKGVVEVLGMLANAQAGVAKPKSCYATPSGGCKRKHDGRGGDRKSALYKLQK